MTLPVGNNQPAHCDWPRLATIHQSVASAGTSLKAFLVQQTSLIFTVFEFMLGRGEVEHRGIARQRYGATPDPSGGTAEARA